MGSQSTRVTQWWWSRMYVRAAVCDTHTVGGWKLSVKIRNRVGTPKERVCESICGEEPGSGYTGVRWLRGVRRSRSIGHCAQSKKEREEERKKIIVVEYYYYQTQERNAHYYFTAVYYNTAAVYDIIIEYTRFIESGSRRAEQLLVCTLSYYILLFYIIYIILSSGGYRVIIPIPSLVIGSCGPQSSFHKTTSRQCVRVRPYVVVVVRPFGSLLFTSACVVSVPMVSDKRRPRAR